MKTAKQLIKEYLDKGSNMPIEGMALLTKFECELLMEQYAQEIVKNNFVLAGVSGSCSFDATEVKQMYDHLVALFHRSQMNGLVGIDSYDRQQLKKLLKLPDNYR